MGVTRRGSWFGGVVLPKFVDESLGTKDGRGLRPDTQWAAGVPTSFSFTAYLVGNLREVMLAGRRYLRSRLCSTSAAAVSRSVFCVVVTIELLERFDLISF